MARKAVVYDACVIGKSNRSIKNRKQDNALDKRLSAIELFLSGKKGACYNTKLREEYVSLTRTIVNDVVSSFMVLLTEKGHRVKQSTLSTSDYALAREAAWPGHDQHLLAAAIGGGAVTIFSTENRLGRSSAAIKRRFGISVALLL